MRAEVLIDERMFPRGTRMLAAMIETAPIELKVRSVYKGDCEILMVYGTGHPVRRPWQLQHVAGGGRLIGWDLGYWNRDVHNFSMRCTVDRDHPPHMLRKEPGDRWAAAGIPLRNDYRENGPIVVIGRGPKADRMANARPLQAEQRLAIRAVDLYPKRRVIFKPKRPNGDGLPGFPIAYGPIEEVIRGASLVVCLHSNVSVDACIAGVPVVCQDGAASALYGADLERPIIPTPGERLAFLESLAYWNWQPSEAAAAWTYLLGRL